MIGVQLRLRRRLEGRVPTVVLALALLRVRSGECDMIEYVLDHFFTAWVVFVI